RLLHRHGGVVGAVDPDVGVPGRRSLTGLTADAGDVAAVETCDVVRRFAGLRDVLAFPAEERSVELGGRGGIRLAGVDPAGHAGRVPVSLRHGWSSSLVGVTGK